jgi:hypothetical protein
MRVVAMRAIIATRMPAEILRPRATPWRGAGVVRVLALALSTSGALISAGCTSFADPSTVTDLRVLAVRTEPSEIILDVSTPAEAASTVIPDIMVTPLVADPTGGGRPLSVTVTACANDPTAPSPPNNGDDPTGFPAGGVRTTVGSALCAGAPTELPIAADVELATSAAVTARLPAAWVAEAFRRDIFVGADGALHGGFDLGMPVVFQVTARAGDHTVQAIKRVTFWLRPVRDDQVANQSPVVGSVQVYDRRDETTAEPVADAVQPLESGTPIEVPESGLWVDPAPAEAEPYVTAVIDRLTGQVIPHDIAHETVRYTFYATAGTFTPLQTSSELEPGVTVSTRVHIESKYKPPPTGDRPPGAPLDVTIWIVARDERGGASWVTRSLTVPPPPAASAGGASARSDR